MDTDEKRDVHTHVLSKDEQDDYQRTKPDMNKDSGRPVFSSDTDVFVDILSHFSDDHQPVQNIKCEDEQEEDINCHREGGSGDLHVQFVKSYSPGR